MFKGILRYYATHCQAAMLPGVKPSAGNLAPLTGTRQYRIYGVQYNSVHSREQLVCGSVAARAVRIATMTYSLLSYGT